MSVTLCVCKQSALSCDTNEARVDVSPRMLKALEPWLDRLEDRCGIVIDPYDTVQFPTGDLSSLIEELCAAKTHFEQLNVAQEVQLGIEILPDGSRRPMMARIDSEEARLCVEKLVEVAERARSIGRDVLFVG